MAGVLDIASSGRAKCRACGNAIARATLRFGEQLENPYGEGEMTLWFHLACAAHRRPEPLLEALAADATREVPERDALERVARLGVAHPRVPRIDGAEQAPTSQARCRHCREPIARGTWRLRLAFFENARFEGGGFVHLACAEPYFGTRDVLGHVLHFSPGLSGADAASLEHDLATGPTAASTTPAQTE